MFQNYLVFMLAKNTLNDSVALLEFIHGNLIKFQKKALKILLNLTGILLLHLLTIIYYQT